MSVKREEIAQVERELDAVLELIQEPEDTPGINDIKERAYERSEQGNSYSAFG